DSVFFIKTDSTQYKILPFQLVVLIEQDSVQDLLVGLENSPMAIQVAEMSIAKPGTRVTKPVKGMESMFGYGEMAMMMRPSMMGVTTFGGNPGMMMMPQYGAMMGGADAKKGIDKRSVDRRKSKKEELDKLKKVGPAALHDPYYTVVELTVYGQARFY